MEASIAISYTSQDTANNHHPLAMKEIEMYAKHMSREEPL